MTTQPKYYSVAETAKIVRKELASAFASIKFSVKSKSYSGGASISISWTDGPTDAQVSRVTNQFESATFDSMIDLKSHHDSEYNGEAVSWGADWVNTNRRNTAEFLQKVADKTAKKWGLPVPVIAVDKWGYMQPCGDAIQSGGPRAYSLQDLIYQDAKKTFFFNGMRCMEK